MTALRKAVDAGPDLLVVLAGDGTARAAAELCGPKGPLVAPLPGGTMNMLPHAIYGDDPWEDSLRLALNEGEARLIGGGKVEGKTFLCAAILGPPALWAPAREAVRRGQVGVALERAKTAMQRAFTGRLRYALDEGRRAKAESMILMCPLASKVMDDDDAALEAAALDITRAGEVFRLGLNAILRDWREDPAVIHLPCRAARVWSPQSIPALLDGESVRLRPVTEIRYEPAVARILAPPKEEPGERI